MKFFTYLFKFIPYASLKVKSVVVTIIVIVTVIRVVGSFSYGTADMEWWKAYANYSVKENLFDIYGANDSQVISLFRQGLGKDDVIQNIQTKIHYKGYKTHYTEYTYPQPPLYIYPIYFSGLLYSLISPTLDNTRVFNFFLNLEPIFSSILAAIAIYFIVTRLTNKKKGFLAGLLYYSHPLIWLNAPIQGYRDPLVGLFVLLSVYMLYQKKLTYSYIFLICAAFTKPQGFLIAPIIVAVSFFEYHVRKNIASACIGICMAIVLSLPFIVTGHGLSMILGISTISDVTQYLSGTPNIWLPVQYAIGVYQDARGGDSFIHAVFGYTFSHVSIAGLSNKFQFNIEYVGYLLLALFTIINLIFLRKSLNKNRRTHIFIAAFLQIYAYVMLRIGVQINHYYSMIALATVVIFIDKRWVNLYTIICSIYIIYDFLFYGVGREFVQLYTFLEQVKLLWIINILAFMNIFAFIQCCRYAWFKTIPIFSNPAKK